MERYNPRDLEPHLGSVFTNRKGSRYVISPDGNLMCSRITIDGLPITMVAGVKPNHGAELARYLYDFEFNPDQYEALIEKYGVLPEANLRLVLAFNRELATKRRVRGLVTSSLASVQ